MRRKQIWRFYCEHCTKSGCSGAHISRHEKHCLRNPERECRMCARLDQEQLPMGLLKAALGKADEAGLANIRGLTDCPMCISAAIMQTGGYIRETGEMVRYDPYSPKQPEVRLVDFDYKKETAAVWAAINEEEQRSEYCSQVL